MLLLLLMIVVLLLLVLLRPLMVGRPLLLQLLVAVQVPEQPLRVLAVQSRARLVALLGSREHAHGRRVLGHEAARHGSVVVVEDGDRNNLRASLLLAGGAQASVEASGEAIGAEGLAVGEAGGREQRAQRDHNRQLEGLMHFERLGVVGCCC